jgi:hypothetical protein
MIIKCFDGKLCHEFGVQVTDDSGYFGTYTMYEHKTQAQHMFYTFSETGQFLNLNVLASRGHSRAVPSVDPPNRLCRQFMAALQVWYRSLQTIPLLEYLNTLGLEYRFTQP